MKFERLLTLVGCEAGAFINSGADFTRAPRRIKKSSCLHF